MAGRKRSRKIFTAAHRRKNEASNQTTLHGGWLKSIITILAGRGTNTRQQRTL